MAPDPFGIAAIGTYLPETRLNNVEAAKRFDFTDEFLTSKIGILAPARKAPEQETSDLCVEAFKDLQSVAGDMGNLNLVAVVTQNPDGHGLPHTSAIVHQKLKLPKTCFAFDISLGCSGFVAALAIVKGYLAATGGRRAVLLTADPYSKVQDPNDRNTALIFGDGAAATLIEETSNWRIGPAFDFGTDGSKSSALKVSPEGLLAMNGRMVFDFCALNVPGSVDRTLQANGLAKSDVDGWVFHPGSKYIVDTIRDRLKIGPIPFPAPYGNTVSSSIPMILKQMDPAAQRTVVISGFGVGLSWATTVLRSET